MDLNTSNNRPASAGLFFDLTSKVVGFLMSIALLALVALVCTEVGLRGVFGISLGFAEEVTGYLVVALTLFGASLAVRKNSLFRVEFLYLMLGSKTRRLVNLLFIVLAIVICGVLAWKAYGLVESSFNRGKFAPTVLKTPLWIPQMLMPLGFAAIVTFLIEQLLLSLRSEEKS